MKTTNPELTILETLEARIAPASMISYTDVDGDIVKVTSSKGDLTNHAVFAADGAGQQLEKLDLTDDIFANANIKVTVKKSPGGDGLANVGFIDAAGNDLGAVSVKGDLGRIVAGDTNDATPAIKSLRVNSFGVLGTSTQGGVIGGGTLPGAVTNILDNLLGSDGVVPGLLQDVQKTVSDLLANQGGLPTVPDNVFRTLNNLLTNINSLTDLGDLGNLGGVLPGGRSLLGNIADAVSELLNTNNIDNIVGGELGNLLDLSNVQLVNLSNLLPSGVELGVDVNDLLGLDINALLGINLGGLLGLNDSLGDILGDLGDNVGDLLNLNELNNVPLLNDLLGNVDDVLQDLLGGNTVLNGGAVDLLSNLQTTIAGLLGINGITDTLTNTAVDLLGTVNDTLQNVLGAVGLADPNHSLSSDIHGDVRSLRVDGDMQDVFFNVDGNIKSITIKGSLIGSEVTNGGHIYATDDITSIRIGKNIIGGEAVNSGSITAGGFLKTLSVRGSIVGGEGAHSGSVSANDDLTSFTVRGDVTGGGGAFSGSIVGHDGRIGRVSLGGSVVAGDGDESGTMRAHNDIGAVRIGGGVVGDDDHRVIMSAGGMETKKGLKNPAFGNIAIGSSMNFADFLAGYTVDLTGANADAQIGNVNVRGSWVASNIVAGVDGTSQDTYGTASDEAIAASDNSTIISRIASLVVRGSAFGTMGGGDHYGIVAQEIGRATLGNVRVPLDKGPDNDVVELAQTTGDVTLREVSTSA